MSRLGGRPNLPKAIPWPEGQEAQPLSFIAQLDLTALPPVRGLPLPRTGSLFFFYDAENQPWGYDPKHEGGAQAIYDAAPLSGNRARALHRDLDEEACFKGVALTATPETSFPGINSGLLREFQATGEEADAYWEFLRSHSRSTHRIGGHADEIQGDVRLEAQLVSNGIYCGDGGGYAKGRKLGLDAGAVDWRTLLQVDSEERSGMMWGDAGRLYFMIHKDHLKRRRFDSVWSILQCY